MTYLISAYSVNPYNGSEDGVGWNWILQYEKNWKPGDRIIVLTKKYNEQATKQGFLEHGVCHVELVIVDVPMWLNWFRQKYSIFHHMYYILWQHWAWLWVKNSGIQFDVIHHVTMGDYRIPGEMYKAKTARTIFGPVGGAQVTPKSLKCYEHHSLWSKFRECVNWFCSIDPIYKRKIRRFSEAIASNKETYEAFARIRGEKSVKNLVEIGISDDLRSLEIGKTVNVENGKAKILYVGRIIEKKRNFLFIRCGT